MTIKSSWLITAMLFSYLIPVWAVCSNSNSNHTSISSVLCEPKVWILSVFGFLCLALFTLLYESQRPSSHSTFVPVVLLLVSTLGVLRFPLNDEPTAHYACAMIVLFSIMLWIYQIRISNPTNLVFSLVYALQWIMLIGLLFTLCVMTEYFIIFEATFLLVFAGAYLYAHRFMK